MKKTTLILCLLLSTKLFSQKIDYRISQTIMTSPAGFFYRINMATGDTTYGMEGDTGSLVKYYFQHIAELENKIEASRELILSLNCVYIDFTEKQRIRYKKAQKKWVKLMGYRVENCCKTCK